ncbi:MAG TPA: transposase [Actinomycetes bacterium]|nr:transposase [Actinomycetes bacterium]
MPRTQRRSRWGRDRPGPAGRRSAGRWLPGDAVNPQVVSQYRSRHGSSRANSDRGDAKVLADLVRTDRHNHRLVAGDSSLAEAVKVLARAHQSLNWTRQRHVNALRSALRDFYPGR